MAFVPLNTNNSNLANYNSVNGLMVDYQGFKKAASTQSMEGWVAGVLPTISSVTYNGNRSYDVTFSGTVADYLSPGIRLKTVRQVAAPTQCTSLNGTTQYFNKTSPAGMTFTNNFTCMGWVKLSSYQAGSIVNRLDASINNGYRLSVTSTGQVELLGLNTLNANNRTFKTYQSVPLSKFVHVAMTWATGVGTAYIDGTSVDITTTTSGTAPTTITQGTGDFAVGRNASSAANFFNGKIAQPAVFSAVLSAATIRSYYSQGLTGTETSLVSAYSFNGVITDLNTTNANNLTAQASAVATDADSPFSVNGSGTATGTDDVALVQVVSSTVATVQVPAGCTIPTSGGIAATYVSTVKNPFNWVIDKDKWEILNRNRTLAGPVPPVINTYYNAGALQLNVPKGIWDLRHVNNVYSSLGTAGVVKVITTLSTSNSAESDRRYSFDTEHANVLNASCTTDHTETVNLSASTIYYGIIRCEVTTCTAIYFLGDRADVSIRALPSGL